MNLIGFVILSLFATQNKTLLWNRPPEQFIDYWTVEMQGGPNIWYRMGSTKQPQFMLPTGPYYRTFRVIAWPPAWTGVTPLPPSPPSQPFTTHL